MAKIRFDTLAVSKSIAPEKLSALLAKFAKLKRDQAIKAGIAAPQYITYVDGREGADESSVRPDGAIRYVFASVVRAAVFAHTLAKASSPRISGDFDKRWVILINGKIWRGKDSDIPPNSVAHVVNTSDHARITEVGKRRKLGLGYKLVDKVVKNTKRRYPTLRVILEFIDIGSGYRLHTTRGRRQKEGQEITYPAVRISHES